MPWIKETYLFHTFTLYDPWICLMSIIFRQKVEKEKFNLSWCRSLSIPVSLLKHVVCISYQLSYYGGVRLRHNTVRKSLTRMAVNYGPQTKLRRLCFYTCLSVHGGGGEGGGAVHGRGCMHGRGVVYGRGRGHVWQRGHVWWRGCGAGGHVWQGACMHGRGVMHAMHTPPSQILQDMVIWAMSGWYASYWNAF